MVIILLSVSTAQKSFGKAKIYFTAEYSVGTPTKTQLLFIIKSIE